MPDSVLSKTYYMRRNSMYGSLGIYVTLTETQAKTAGEAVYWMWLLGKEAYVKGYIRVLDLPDSIRQNARIIET